jgi:RNase P/RNase MRP subunit POP5
VTWRMKRRYLLLHVVGDQSISEGDLMDTLWKALFQLFGEYGASQARLTLIEYNSQEGWAIVRCLNEALEMVRASITSITEIDDKPAAIHVSRVSGTLKALRKKAQLQD